MKYLKILNNKIIQYDENAKDLDKPAILFYKDDIKDADTIEALYDGYYIDDLYTKVGFNYDGIFDEFDEFKDNFLCLLYEDKANIAGYAFIKTNKGFIFVAKMNDRGKLNPIIQK